MHEVYYNMYFLALVNWKGLETMINTVAMSHPSGQNVVLRYHFLLKETRAS